MSKGVIRHGVFIASTNDLPEERQAVIEAIVQWNQEHWDSGIAYAPLMWETGTVADSQAARPQDAITEQLFGKASALIGLFKHRLGSGGTLEEIKEALARERFPTALFFSSEPVPFEVIDEAQQLKAWRDQSSGLSLDFEDVERLKSRVRSQLNKWSRELPSGGGGASDIAVESLAPEDYIKWFEQANPQARPCTILLYNTELATFSSAEAFLRIWSNLARVPSVQKIALMLPSFKLRRLKDYRASWGESAEMAELLSRFVVCPLSSTRSEAHKVATSTAFCLLREGADPAAGAAMPRARLFILSEPFSKPQWHLRAPEVVWRYQYTFLTDKPDVLNALLEIWDDSYSPEQNIAMTEISEAVTPAAPAEVLMDPEHAPASGEDILPKVRLLREHLFEPNVPSYLLDAEFFMLDWNPAFEMVFPTREFYRRENVQEFVKQLDNSAEIFQRGRSFVENRIGYFDSELLRYRSPKYGDMEFSKMASRVDDPVTRETIGWIVALNVNKCQNSERYQKDLRDINEIHSLYSVYAQPYRNILGNFPPYLDLIHRHIAALAECETVLDAGCGPGLLAMELIRAGKKVTAVDSNDRMLDLARETFKDLTEDQRSRLSLVKANLQTLHRPNPTYLKSRIGIFKGYDGMALLNSYHPICNPATTLKRIRQDLLKPGALLAMSLPSADTDLDVLFEEIQRSQSNLDRDEWNILTKVNLELAEQGRLTRNSGTYREDLQQAGFELEQEPEVCFAGQGLFVVARAV